MTAYGNVNFLDIEKPHLYAEPISCSAVLYRLPSSTKLLFFGKKSAYAACFV